MPSVIIHPRPTSHSTPPTLTNPLPSLLRTPLGLAIIEIQGTLNIPAPPQPDPSDVDNTRDTNQHIDIGRLVFPLLDTNANHAGVADVTTEGPWMKKVYLYIGDNQRLLGEVRKLTKVIAVLRRRVGEVGHSEGKANGVVEDAGDDVVMNGTGDDDENENGADAIVNGKHHHNNGTEEEEELEIADLVRYKLVFSARPEFV